MGADVSMSKKLSEDADAYFKSQPSIGPRDLKFGAIIGRGGFGDVRLVYGSGTHHMAAAKILKMKNPKNVEEFRYECELLKSLDHPNVISLYGYYQETVETSDYGIQVFPIALHDLTHYHKVKLNLHQLLYFFHEALKALSYLEEKLIVHTDVKPENFLLLYGQNVKLADFGSARQLQDSKEKLHSYCGTYAYWAPERWNGEGYSFQSDLWAAGVSLVEVAQSGISPFDPLDNPLPEEQVKEAVLDLQACYLASLSPNIRYFAEMIFVSEKQRVSTNEMMMWIKECIEYFGTHGKGDLHGQEKPL